MLCQDFRLDAELRWGPKREVRTFHLDAKDGLISHYADTGTYVPAELGAFVERFRQVAPDWEVSEATDVLELGRDGVWVPDYRFIHKSSEVDVFVEVVGFWKKSSLERLLRLLPEHGPPRYLLAISDRVQGRRSGPWRASRAGPPVQGDPQRGRTGRPPRPPDPGQSSWSPPRLNDSSPSFLNDLFSNRERFDAKKSSKMDDF